MATKHRIDPEQPPSPKEIAELVRRIQERSEGRLDVREHGAVTVSDMAEATGASDEVVRRHLERIRAERAILESPAKPKSQIPMLCLAVGLLATAFAVYRLTPHPITQAEMEEHLAEIKEKRAHSPKKIHYPIETKLTEVLPPRGFGIEIRGQYTTTRVQPGERARFMDAEHAGKQLAAALAAAYATAIQNEAAAPRPEKPLPATTSFGNQPTPDTFLLSIGNSVIPLPAQVPAQIPPEGRQKWIADSADSTAKGIVEGIQRSQEMELKQEDLVRRTSPASPPAGFNLSFAGRRQSAYMAGNIQLLPLNPDRVVSRMKEAIRSVMESDLKPLGFSTPDMRARDEKTPVPSWSKISIQGPMGAFEFRIPTAPSKEYPTASDVMAGAEKTLNTKMAALRQRIVEFNRTGESVDRP